MNQYSGIVEMQLTIQAVVADYHDNIAQNSVILHHCDAGKREMAQLMGLLTPTHPGYRIARSAMNRFQAQEQAEFDEDVRHKGLTAKLEKTITPLLRLLGVLKQINPNVEILINDLQRIKEELTR